MPSFISPNIPIPTGIGSIYRPQDMSSVFSSDVTVPDQTVNKQVEANAAKTVENTIKTGTLDQPQAPVDTAIALGPDPREAARHADVIRKLATPIVAARIKSGEITADNYVQHDIAMQDYQRQAQGLPAMSDEEKSQAATKSTGFWNKLGLDGKTAALLGASMAGAILFRDTPAFNQAFQQQFTLSREQSFAQREAEKVAKAKEAQARAEREQKDKQFKAEDQRYRDIAQGENDRTAQTISNQNLRTIYEQDQQNARNREDNAAREKSDKVNQQGYTYDQASQVVSDKLATSGMKPEQIQLVTGKVAPAFLDIRRKHPELSDDVILNGLIFGTPKHPGVVSPSPDVNPWYKPAKPGYTLTQ